MAVPSDGSYGIPEGLIYSFPCRVDAQGNYEIVQGVELSEFAKAKAMNSADELSNERDLVKGMLG